MKYRYYKFMSFLMLKFSHYSKDHAQAVKYLTRSVEYFDLAIGEALK